MNRAALLAVVVLSLLRCGGSSGPPPVGVPDPDLGGMEPRVAQLLARTRQAVLEHADAASWGELGATYDAHGLLGEAEICYRRARELDPDAFEWTYLLAVVREVRGAATDEVVERFAQAAAARPNYVPIHVRLGAALALRGEHALARDAFERALAIDADHAIALRGLGQVLLAAGDAEAAVQPLERAAEREPRDLAAQTGLAQAYLRTGRPALAERTIERSRGLEPVNAFDDPVYAERVFLRSMSSSRAFSRAQAALRTGRFDQAVEDLAIVVEARSDDGSAHYWKGMAHRRLGQTAEASRHLSRAVELEPNLVQARVEFGALLVGQGRHVDAVEQLEAAAALRALDADGHYGLGLAYEALGRVEDARAQFLAAAALDPDHPAAARLGQSP